MKHVLIVCYLLLIVQPLRAQGGPNRDAHWRDDVDYVWQQIQRVHPDPFRSTPQTTFAQMVSDLDAQIPNLSDAQIVVRLFALVAALHDGHSFFWFTQNAYPFKYYPLLFYPFSDGVYLVEAAPPYADLVGDRLDKIGTTDAAQVLQTLTPLTPHDNQYSSLVTIPILLSMSDALLGTGLITDANQPAYLLEGADGKPITINPAPVGLTQYQAAIPIPVQLPARAGVLSLSHLDQTFWSTALSDGQTLYIQYNAVQSADPAFGGGVGV